MKSDEIKKKDSDVVELESGKDEAFSNCIKLKKKIEFEGKVIEEINLNLENLSGEDIEKCEMQFISHNPEMAAQTPLKEMSKGFLAMVAAKSAKKPVELIRSLSASDYSKVTSRVQIFLMSGN